MIYLPRRRRRDFAKTQRRPAVPRSGSVIVAGVSPRKQYFPVGDKENSCIILMLNAQCLMLNDK
jgi:hypothetical protein